MVMLFLPLIISYRLSIPFTLGNKTLKQYMKQVISGGLVSQMVYLPSGKHWPMTNRKPSQHFLLRERRQRHSHRTVRQLITGSE